MAPISRFKGAYNTLKQLSGIVVHRTALIAYMTCFSASYILYLELFSFVVDKLHCQTLIEYPLYQ